MAKVKIIVDSTCDLTEDIMEKYDIAIVPLYVEFDEESYRDGVDIVPEQLFQKVKEKGILPKSAAPSPFDFSMCFQKYLDQGYDIIVITISTKMSSTYQNALVAASEFPQNRIWIIDSGNITTGISSLVTVAGEAAIGGRPAEEIAKTIKALVPKVRVNFVIDTLEYLYKGGRCNAVENFFGSLLRIKPIIGVQNGSLYVADKVRGDKKRALDKMIAKVIKNKENIAFDRIFINNSCGNDDEAEYVKTKLQQELPGVEIVMTKAGCVISTHCGEKTLGISYIQK
ncbi:MAG: DegV family protein [Peptococcaceae bacterium]|jgi:DegV family protein with EDD domain|nr:DegV family protein [Peptococcaceae bacterium]